MVVVLLLEGTMEDTVPQLTGALWPCGEFQLFKAHHFLIVTVQRILCPCLPVKSWGCPRWVALALLRAGMFTSRSRVSMTMWVWIFICNTCLIPWMNWIKMRCTFSTEPYILLLYIDEGWGSLRKPPTVSSLWNHLFISFCVYLVLIFFLLFLFLCRTKQVNCSINLYVHCITLISWNGRLNFTPLLTSNLI